MRIAERKISIQQQEPASLQYGRFTEEPPSTELRIKQGKRNLSSQDLDVSKVGGKLALFVEKWKLITTNKFVLDTVKGYKIKPKYPVIQPFVPKEPNRSLPEMFNLKSEIEALLSKNLIKKCTL